MTAPAPAVPRAQFEAYALTFTPRLEERVWGGGGLARYGKAVISGATIGESWEISDVEGKASEISRGAYAGTSLRTLMERHAEAILGKSEAPRHPAGGPQFPLLLKLLDARQDLSVQVHPSDEDLLRSGVEASGKTEAWVILDADSGSRIVHGLPRDVKRAALIERMERLGGSALARDDEERLFHWVRVERGDVVFVPAGTIHAVGKEILLLEVQQTSDITYRIYDWGRAGKDGKPRELHLDEAMGVSDTKPVPCPFAKIFQARDAEGFVPLVSCPYFQVEVATLGTPGSKAELRSSTRKKSGASFHILAGYEGAVVYTTPAGDHLEIQPGVFALLPAVLGEYTLAASGSGPAQVLRVLSANG